MCIKLTCEITLCFPMNTSWMHRCTTKENVMIYTHTHCVFIHTNTQQQRSGFLFPQVTTRKWIISAIRRGGKQTSFIWYFTSCKHFREERAQCDRGDVDMSEKNKKNCSSRFLHLTHNSLHFSYTDDLIGIFLLGWHHRYVSIHHLPCSSHRRTSNTTVCTIATRSLYQPTG